MPEPLRIAVIGAGAFGRNHLRVLHDLARSSHDAQLQSEPTTSPLGSSPLPPEPPPAVQLVAAVDPNPDARDFVSSTYNISTFATVDALLAADLHLHAAIVAVPTVAHAEVAAQLLEANLDVLIEKPLTATLAEADALLALAASKGRILAAGHLERFNPAVTAALPRLTRPLFFEAHRLSIFTPRSLDVDVVLDLMIHDLDILLTMTQSPVAEIRAVGLPVLSRKVDIANVRLEFRSGAIANLTASRVSTEQIRKLRLFQPAQYLSLDYARQELLTIDIDPKQASTWPSSPGPLPSHPEVDSSQPSRPHTSSTKLAPAPEAQSAAAESSPSPSVGKQAASSSTPHPSAGLNFEKSTLPRVEPLRLELEDFLRAVATRSQPRVSAEAARNALALALSINAAIQQHTAKLNLEPARQL